jgi:ribulose-5-phosphate 4-epimerase/fuculose-1-phosphate aldolase
VHRAIYLNTDSYGVFAKGSTLEAALQNVTGPEQAAQTRYLTILTGKPQKREYSKEKIFALVIIIP